MALSADAGIVQGSRRLWVSANRGTWLWLRRLHLSFEVELLVLGTRNSCLDTVKEKISLSLVKAAGGVVSILGMSYLISCLSY